MSAERDHGDQVDGPSVVRIVISVAVLTLTLTISVLWALVAWTSPWTIDDRDFQALMGWSAYGNALTSLLAVGAAVVAYLNVRSEIKQAQSNHEAQISELRKSREAALTPVVRLSIGAAVDGSEADITIGDALLSVTVQNIGPGAALACTAKIWVEALAESEDPQPGGELTRWELAMGDPAINGSADSLAASERAASFRWHVSTVEAPGDRYLLLWRTDCRDIFGSRQTQGGYMVISTP